MQQPAYTVTAPRGSRTPRRAAEERALRLLQQNKRRWPGARLLQGSGLQEHLDRYSGSAVDVFLIQSHEVLTARRQAELLKVSTALVVKWRARLYEQGRIQRETRASHRPMTDAEAESYARLRRAGWTLEGIADLRQTSRNRVRRGLEQAGLTDDQIIWFSPLDVARLFTVSREVVRLWVRDGLLPDLRTRNDDDEVVPGCHHRWDYSDVIAFVRNRETWIAWEPVQITDPELRTLAERERARAGGAWWQLGEIAAWLGISPMTLSTWRRNDGLFPDYRQRAGGRFVWLTDAQRVELQAWGAAVQTLRLRSDRRRWATVDMRRKLRAYAKEPT